MPPQHTTPDQFWSKVAVSSPDACWPWQASLTHDGYGQVYWNGTMRRAHRIAYELTYGPIPAGQLVRHSCDDRPCCNPAHLLAGTHKDNTADMDARGRRGKTGVSGMRNGRAKLTSADIAYIRTHHNRRTMPQMKLAAMFGVDQTTISYILLGKSWREPE